MPIQKIFKLLSDIGLILEEACQSKSGMQFVPTGVTDSEK